MVKMVNFVLYICMKSKKNYKRKQKACGLNKNPTFRPKTWTELDSPFSVSALTIGLVFPHCLPNLSVSPLPNMGSFLELSPWPQVLESAAGFPWVHLEDVKVVWPQILPNCQDALFFVGKSKLVAHLDCYQCVIIPQGPRGCPWLGLLPPSPACLTLSPSGEMTISPSGEMERV